MAVSLRLPAIRSGVALGVEKVTMTMGLTVFLCSTFEDLSDERQQVMDATRKLQLQHDSMEFFGARSGLPIDTCLEEVRRSDVLVIIVGHRYGTLVPDLDVSYSQAEYEEGYRLRKPCLVYLRDENVPVLLRFVERDPDNLRRLENWKNTLTSRHTAATFTNSHDLAVRVAADLARTVQSLDEAERAKEQAAPKTEDARISELARIVDDAVAEGLDHRTVLSSLRYAVGDLVKTVKRPPPTVFLSHSHEDNEVVREFATGLRENGLRVWLDEAELKIGDSLVEKIEHGLDAADYVAFFLSSHSLKSPWAQQELNVAMSRQISGGRGASVLPVLLEDVELPPLLRSVVYLDLRNRDIQSAVQKFVDAVAARRAADSGESLRLTGNAPDHPSGIRAYIAITVRNPAARDKALRVLVQCPELIEVSETFGNCDLMAVLNVTEMSAVQSIVQKVVSVEGIASTQTLIGASPPYYFKRGPKEKDTTSRCT
jgi:hypothetical protein